MLLNHGGCFGGVLPERVVIAGLAVRPLQVQRVPMALQLRLEISLVELVARFLPQLLEELLMFAVEAVRDGGFDVSRIERGLQPGRGLGMIFDHMATKLADRGVLRLLGRELARLDLELVGDGGLLNVFLGADRYPPHVPRAIPPPTLPPAAEPPAHHSPPAQPPP